MADCKHSYARRRMSFKLPDDALSGPLGEPSVVCDLCDYATPVWDRIEQLERERNEARAQAAALRAALEPLLADVPLLVVDTDRIRQVLAATTAPLDAVRAMMAATRALVRHICDRCGCDGSCDICAYRNCGVRKPLQAAEAALTAMAGQFGGGQV
jgi:hypothetical protein